MTIINLENYRISLILQERFIYLATNMVSFNIDFMLCTYIVLSFLPLLPVEIEFLCF